VIVGNDNGFQFGYETGEVYLSFGKAVYRFPGKPLEIVTKPKGRPLEVVGEINFGKLPKNPSQNFLLKRTAYCHVNADGSETVVYLRINELSDHVDVTHPENTRADHAPGLYYRDVDGDGYGDASDPVENTCRLPGYVDVAGDCDPFNSLINPGQVEIQNDSVDNDCDASTPDVFALCPCEATWDDVAGVAIDNNVLYQRYDTAGTYCESRHYQQEINGGDGWFFNMNVARLSNGSNRCISIASKFDGGSEIPLTQLEFSRVGLTPAETASCKQLLTRYADFFDSSAAPHPGCAGP